MDTPEYKRLLRYFFLNKISKQSFDSHLRLILKNPKDIDYHNKKMSKIFVNAVNAEPVLPVEGYRAKKIKLDYENSVSPSQGSSASKNSTQPVPLADILRLLRTRFRNVIKIESSEPEMSHRNRK